jgi:ketosteroid isomerase-like protein
MTDLMAKVLRSIAAWNRGDFDACVDFAHPDVEWTSGVAEKLSGDAIYRGVDGVRRYWDEWHELWRVRLDVREIGDTVVVVACTEARGDLSGVILRQRIGYTYEFEDRMARRVRSFIDPDDAFEAVGIERESASDPELYSAASQGR